MYLNNKSRFNFALFVMFHHNNYFHDCRSFFLFCYNVDLTLYSHYIKELFIFPGNTDNLALPSFVDFNNLTSYHLSEQGTKTVAKILAVIQNTNPEILYCPTIYAKLSIFLHYMGPSDAFNCIYALLRSKEANIMQTKVAVEASKLVLRDLTKKYAVIFF